MTVPHSKPVILVVIDGLTPTMLEDAVEAGKLPVLARLVEHGNYRRATSVFPSLTPVCLSSIATGAHGDVHEIPHLVWYHRGERRLVEYGSSFGAVRAAGIGQTLRDTLVNMNVQHLGKRAVTVFEALSDAGLRTASVNFTAYRGRTAHRSSLPFLGDVLGPDSFFFYNLFQSERTGAPLSWRNRAAGSIDAYATAVGRWLVTRDAFDFLVYYLSDYDYASHEHGPDAAYEALARCDDAVGALAAAAGGFDELLDRYALVVLSDHGQTHVREVASLGRCYAGVEGVLVTASNRAAQLYVRPGCTLDPRQLARVLDGEPSVDVVLFREGDRRDRAAAGRGAAVRPRPGRLAALRRRVHPRSPRRARACLGSPRQPECGGDPRLGGRRLGVRRPRRGPPSRGRFARIAARGRLRGAPADDRHRRDGAEHRRRRSARAAALRRRAAALRARSCRLTATTRAPKVPRARVWSNVSSGGAGSATSASSPPWDGCRESSSCLWSCATRPTRTRRCRSVTGRRSRSPSSSRRPVPLLGLRGDERVLDVGTGSGYAACVLAELAAEVITIERIPELAAAAAAALARAGHPDVDVRVGDGSLGVPDRAPYDAVAVAAAAPSIPEALVAQLSARGRLVLPRGTRHSQKLVLLERRDGTLTESESVPCRFVPLLGAAGFEEA